MNYAYLDGLRGIGAFIVYLTHFNDHFYPLKDKEDMDKDPQREKSLPQWTKSTPVIIFIHGYFWVVVFFILSGFVLTLRFFKIRKHTCITGETFRRYLRLMIPLWVTISLYYFVLKMEFPNRQDIYAGDNDITRFKDKTFLDLTYDCLFNVWYGDNTWSVPIWTLSLELTATFMVYTIAQTVVEYRWRGWIYFFIIMFFLIPFLVVRWKFSK